MPSISSKYGQWLRFTPYFVGGFSCFLSYLLILRLGRIPYVFQYISYTTNPVLFTPHVDLAVWTILNGVLSCIALSVYWRKHKLVGAKILVSFMSVLTVAAASLVFFLGTAVIPWLIPISFLPLAYLLYEPSGGLDRGRCFQTSAYAVVGTWLLIQIGSVFSRVLLIEGIYPFSVDIQRQIMSLSIDLMYVLQNCSVLFFFTVGFSWLTIPLFIFAFEKKRFSTLSTIKGKWPGRAILLASIVLSGTAIAIQYFRYPDLRGVDTMYYVNQLASAKDFAALVQLLPGDPRIVYVLFLKCLTSVGASNDLSVKLGSLVLMGLNASAYYLLGEELLGDSFGGGLVALFSALGSQTAVSLYAGIYANWLSLSLAACAFAFYLRAVRSGKGIFFFVAGFFLVMCLLTHPWSGLVYSLVLVTTCALDIVAYRRDRWHFLVALACAVCIIILLAYLYAPYRGSVLTLSDSFEVSNVQKAASNLEFTINYMVGGFLSVPYIVFAVIGFWALGANKPSSTEVRLLSVWLAAAFMPVLFAEQWLQWRLIYLMPIQVLSGVGIYYLCHFMVHMSKERLALLTLIVCATLLTIFNYLLASVRFIPSV